MRFVRSPKVLIVFGGVIGGLLITSLSGLYAVERLVIDHGQAIDYGLPFAWCMASRGYGMGVLKPWHYYFMWWYFVIDFLIYWLLISGVTSFYFVIHTRGFFKSPRILMVFDSVSGGLLFALLSGLYPVKWLYQYNGEIIAYGFPLAWFEADWVGYRSWVYQFILQNFVVDFVIYGLVVSVVVYLYLSSASKIRP